MLLAPTAVATTTPLTAFVKLSEVFTSLGSAYSAISPYDVRPAVPHVSTARTQAYEAVALLEQAQAEMTDPVASRFLDAALLSTRSGADNLGYLQGYARDNYVDGYYKFSDAVYKQFEVAFDAVRNII